MANGALKFFNPASLLPSPDVAVAPAPVADHTAIGMALFDSMKQFRQLAKDKRDLENLRSETKALGDYFGETSPELKSYLYNKANQYDLLTTDLNKERSGLLTGSIGLFNSESARLKAEKDTAAMSLDNNWKTQLTAANNNYENLLRAKQNHEDNQTRLKIAHDRAQDELMKLGHPTTEFVYTPFSQESELQSAGRTRQQLSEMTPEEILARATQRSGNKSIVGKKVSDARQSQSQDTGLNSIIPDAPGSGIDPNNDPSNPPLPVEAPGSPIDASLITGSPPAGRGQVPIDEPDGDGSGILTKHMSDAEAVARSKSIPAAASPESPQLTANPEPPSLLPESASKGPSGAVGDTGAPASDPRNLLTPPPTPEQMAAADKAEQDAEAAQDPNKLIPGRPIPTHMDTPRNRAALANLEGFQAIADLKKQKIDQLVHLAQRNKQYIDDPVALEDFVNNAYQYKKQIDQATKLGAGLPKWEPRMDKIVGDAIFNYKDLRMITPKELELRKLAKQNQTFEFYQDGHDPSKKELRFKVVKKNLPDGRSRLYAKDWDTGKMDRDVTTLFRRGEIKPAPGVDLKSLDTSLLEREDVGEIPDILPDTDTVDPTEPSPTSSQPPTGNVPITTPGISLKEKMEAWKKRAQSPP